MTVFCFSEDVKPSKNAFPFTLAYASEPVPKLREWCSRAVEVSRLHDRRRARYDNHWLRTDHYASC
jgi:hypothetical protein